MEKMSFFTEGFSIMSWEEGQRPFFYISELIGPYIKKEPLSIDRLFFLFIFICKQHDMAHIAIFFHLIFFLWSVVC